MNVYMKKLNDAQRMYKSSRASMYEAIADLAIVVKEIGNDDKLSEFAKENLQQLKAARNPYSPFIRYVFGIDNAAAQTPSGKSLINRVSKAVKKILEECPKVSIADRSSVEDFIKQHNGVRGLTKPLRPVREYDVTLGTEEISARSQYVYQRLAFRLLDDEQGEKNTLKMMGYSQPEFTSISEFSVKGAFANGVNDVSEQDDQEGFCEVLLYRGADGTVTVHGVKKADLSLQGLGKKIVREYEEEVKVSDGQSFKKLDAEITDVLHGIIDDLIKAQARAGTKLSEVDDVITQGSEAEIAELMEGGNRALGDEGTYEEGNEADNLGLLKIPYHGQKVGETETV